MRATRYALVLVAALSAAGCYHTTVVTGATPGTTVVDRPFALGFIFGIVPPPTLSVASECPDGVAIVETQQSIVNGLVSIITGGIVTPMQITVTCAAGGSSALPADAEEVTVTDGAAVPAVQGAFAEAADRAVASGEPVLVRFE